MAEFEPVTLFVRGDEQTSDEDAWDDTILVEQYDRSVNQLKNKVAKLMGENSGIGDNISGKSNSKDSKHHRKRPEYSWEVGSFCRAKYSEDKIFYEAAILSVNKERGTCRVKYIGYGNQEDVYLDNLLPSEGHAARQTQKDSAMLEHLQHIDDTEDTEEMINSDSNSVREDHKKSRKKGEAPPTDYKPSKWQKNKTSSPVNRTSSSQNMHTNKGNQFGWPSHVPDASSFPPPPPPPPHIFEHLPSDDGEALSAMLMSWYMSGYHTGYYYGMKQAKSQQKFGHSGHYHGRWTKT